MDFNSIDEGSRKRIVDQVMQGYGRFKPSDRNTVANYLSSNPDYMNTIAARLGMKGASAPDERYENAQDSMAMKTLMKSMNDSESGAGPQDAAKPSPTAVSGRKGPKGRLVDTQGYNGEGLNPRTNMQSEAASDEIARRKGMTDNRREAIRARGLGNVGQSQEAGPQTSPNNQGGSGVGDAITGLSIGGTLGYLLNRMFPSSTKVASNNVPEAKSAAQAAKGGLPAVINQGSTAMTAMENSLDDGAVPKQIEGPRAQIEGPRKQLTGPPRMIAANPQQPLQIDYQPGVTLDNNSRSILDSILESAAKNSGPTMNINAGKYPEAGNFATEPVGKAINAETMRSIRTQASRMGKFK